MDVSQLFHIVQLFINVTDESLRIQIMDKMSQGSSFRFIEVLHQFSDAKRLMQQLSLMNINEFPESSIYTVRLK